MDRNDLLHLLRVSIPTVYSGLYRSTVFGSGTVRSYSWGLWLTMNLWHVIHTYHELAQGGLVNELLCPEDASPLGIIVDPVSAPTEPIPALLCPQCLTVIHLGLDFWHQIRSAVLEHITVECLDG